MPLAQHARTAPAPGVARYDSFSLPQGTFTTTSVQAMGPEALHSSQWGGGQMHRLPPVEKGHLMAGERGVATLFSFGAVGVQRASPSRVLGPESEPGL